MILILGAWTFLRALFGSSAAVSLENVALRHQRSACDRPRLAPQGFPALLALEVPTPLNGSPAARY